MAPGLKHMKPDSWIKFYPPLSVFPQPTREPYKRPYQKVNGKKAKKFKAKLRKMGIKLNVT